VEGAQVGEAPEISVVIMAFNEVENLEEAVAEISGTLEHIPGQHEILIVDDGSNDGTGELADRLSTRHPILRVIHHPENRGLGGAYRTGFTQARGQHVIFYPADRQFPARFIPTFHQHMRHADMVLGVRPGRRESWTGEILSVGERLLYRILLGPMPRFHGLVMFRRSLLQTVPLESRGRGWAIMMEFILRVDRAGYRLAHIPIEIRPRAHGESKVNNLPTIWANLKQMVTLRQTLRKR